MEPPQNVTMLLLRQAQAKESFVTFRLGDYEWQKEIENGMVFVCRCPPTDTRLRTWSGEAAVAHGASSLSASL